MFIKDRESSREEQLKNSKWANTIINILLIGRTQRVILTIGLLSILFLAYYSFIATPSNFSSISNTYWYFIPALAMLLSIAAIFNNFILNNEVKAIPSDVQTTIDQTNKITEMLQHVDPEVIDQARRSATAALYYMIKAATDAAKYEDKNGRHLRSICIDFMSSSNYILRLFWHTKSQFSLIMMPTADFINRIMTAATITSFPNSKISNKKEMPKFLQVLLELHALKYVLAGIYIRRSITAISNDMLISVVPIISFIAALSSLNDFSNISMIRILFALGLTIVFLPFILLVVRVIPMVHLIKSNSNLPFSYN